MKIILVDTQVLLCEEWKKSFQGCDDVVTHAGDFREVINQGTEFNQALVSPANSFGIMDGGFDAVITAYFGIGNKGRSISDSVQSRILDFHLSGEQPVGTCLPISTTHEFSDSVALSCTFLSMLRQMKSPTRELIRSFTLSS